MGSYDFPQLTQNTEIDNIIDSGFFPVLIPCYKLRLEPISREYILRIISVQLNINFMLARMPEFGTLLRSDLSCFLTDKGQSTLY